MINQLDLKLNIIEKIMSDTKLQIINNKNQEYINHLKSLYRQEKTIRTEIKFVESRIKENQLYISLRGFRNYDINWCLKVLKNNLKQNKGMIKLVQSKLIIC